MAIPDSQFDAIVDKVTQGIVEEIRKELDERQAQLANAPAPATGAFFNPEEFREEFLELLREELHLFKQELLTDLAQASPALKSTNQAIQGNSEKKKLTAWDIMEMRRQKKQQEK